jgi:hypothetical protein
MTIVRLSRKAQDRAALISGNFDENIRKRASQRAELLGKEFADEDDVTAAMQDYSLEFAEELLRAGITRRT